jgi:hypothetical protein
VNITDPKFVCPRISKLFCRLVVNSALSNAIENFAADEKNLALQNDKKTFEPMILKPQTCVTWTGSNDEIAEGAIGQIIGERLDDEIQSEDLGKTKYQVKWPGVTDPSYHNRASLRISTKDARASPGGPAPAPPAAAPTSFQRACRARHEAATRAR